MQVAGRRGSVARPAFALVIVSFLLSTIVSLMSLHTMHQRNTREVNKMLATQVYDFIASETSGPITAARTMASTSFLVDALRHEADRGKGAFEASMAAYLSSVEDGLGFHSAFVISDATKDYYTRDGYNRTIDPDGAPEDSWYSALASSGKRYDLDVDNDEKNADYLVLYVNARVETKSHELLGICGLGVHMHGLQSLFRTFENTYNVKVNLVSPDGVVQVDTDDDNIETANLKTLIGESAHGEYVYYDLADGFAVSKYVEQLGWYLVVRSAGSDEAGQVANVILLNVALCLVVLVVLFIALRISYRHTAELTSATYLDHATGMHNRRAYEQDKAELLAHSTGDDLVCAACDVNGLKTVNDTLGHDAGDELINGAADCLQQCFGKHGTVYRTGGDEFVVLMRARPEQLDRLRESLTHITSSWRGTEVESVSLSCGYAASWEFPDETVEGLAKIADERMYEDKERHYASKGLTRRTT